ncbi:DoxX family protein [Limnoglobus roseus]|uniref:DoxX family protein n=1 Tax=Limnoglobus roseus TaxID=2598579 RepID=A0A5C1AKF6_9BACT|nr:DoxX family protein [Limnoglobus roseus]QEL19380.1 DoxX family protein [Limnoglobus roseus]
MGLEADPSDRWQALARVLVRLALAASFLSAVADRLGVWGPPGAAGVAWGSVSAYEEYVAKLNWFLPPGVVPVVGWTATVAEVLLAVGLLIGWRLQWVAFAAGVLLTAFVLAMGVALGPKPPLDYSVPSAAAAAFLLAAVSRPAAVGPVTDNRRKS